MMHFYNYLTIKQKLWIWVWILLSFFLLNGLLSYYYSAKSKAFLEPSYVLTIKKVYLLEQYLEEIEHAFNNIQTTRKRRYVKIIEKRSSEFRKILNFLKKNDSENLKSYSGIERIFSYYITSVNQATKGILRNRPKKEISILKIKIRKQHNPLAIAIDETVGNKFEDLIIVLQKIDTISNNHVETDLLLAGFVFVLTIIVAIFLIRSIVNPISNLVKVTKMLGEGKLDTRAEVISNDEIGLLSQSFNLMSERLQDNNKKLKNAIRQLKEADRHKSDFLSSLSHELRTPLNSIINFIEHIIEGWGYHEENDPWFKEGDDILNRVLKSSKHLLSMINDLLDIAKIESGEMKLNLEKIDLGILIKDTTVDIQPIANPKGLTIESEIDKNVPAILCDENRIKQVIMNLLSNAVKFTSKGRILIKLSLTDRYNHSVKIDVFDTGVGISKKNLKIIFERFRQIDSSDSRKFQGTGLGLNLVKEIVKLHHGYMEVKSQLGQGSCFSIYIPKKWKFHDRKER